MTNQGQPWPSRNRRPTVRRAALLAVIVPVALLTACSNKGATPTSQPASTTTSATVTVTTTPSAASADLTVDGHAHTFSGRIDCTAQSANPSGTPPRGDLEIGASDNTASLSISWLSNASSPVTTLGLTFKVDNGE
jgi:hypothetical protein